MELVKSGFSKIKDTRKSNQTYKLETMRNLEFSMFHLKDESLSSYKTPVEGQNLFGLVVFE